MTYATLLSGNATYTAVLSGNATYQTLITHFASASLSATPDLTGVTQNNATAQFAEIATWSSLGIVDLSLFSTATLTATPSLSATPLLDVGITASLSASPSLSSGLTHEQVASSSLEASSALTSDLSLFIPVTAALTSGPLMRFTMLDSYADLAAQGVSYVVLERFIAPDYDWLTPTTIHGLSAALPQAVAATTGVIDISTSVSGPSTSAVADLAATALVEDLADVLNATITGSFTSAALLDVGVTSDLAVTATLSSTLDISSTNPVTLPSAVAELSAGVTLTQFISAALTTSPVLRTGVYSRYSQVPSGFPTYAEVLSDVTAYASFYTAYDSQLIDAALSSGADLSATAAFTHFISADLTASSDLLAGFVQGYFHPASLPTASASASADVVTEQPFTGALPSATGSLASTAITEQPTTADLSAGGLLASVGLVEQFAAAALSVTGTFRPATVTDYQSVVDSYPTYAATLSDVPTYLYLTTGFQTRTGDSSLTISGALATDLTIERLVTADLSASASLTSDVVSLVDVVAALSASASAASVLGSLVPIDAALSASATARPATVTLYSTVTDSYPSYSDLTTDVPTYSLLLTGFQVRTADAGLAATFTSQADATREVLVSAALTSSSGLLSSASTDLSLTASLEGTGALSSGGGIDILVEAALVANTALRSSSLTTYQTTFDSFASYAEVHSDFPTYAAMLTGFQTRESDAALSAVGSFSSGGTIEQFATEDTGVVASLSASAETGRLIEAALSSTAILSALAATEQFSDVSLAATASMRPSSVDTYDDVAASYPSYTDLALDVLHYYWLAFVVVSGDAELTASGSLSAVPEHTQISSASFSASALLRTTYLWSYTDLSEDYPSYAVLLSEALQYGWLVADFENIEIAAALSSSGSLEAVTQSDLLADAALSVDALLRAPLATTYGEVTAQFPTYATLSGEVGEYEWLLFVYQTVDISASLTANSSLATDSQLDAGITADLTATPVLRAPIIERYNSLTQYDTYGNLATDVLEYYWLVSQYANLSIDAGLSASAVLLPAVVTSYQTFLESYPSYAEAARDPLEYSWLLTNAQNLVASADLSASATLRTTKVATYQDVAEDYPSYSALWSDVLAYYWLLNAAPSRLRSWNGVEWQEGTLRYWDGSTWQTGCLRRWNGTEWEDADGCSGSSGQPAGTYSSFYTARY